MDPIASACVTWHMLTPEEAAQYRTLAPDAIAWAACQLRLIGIHHELVLEALKFGEATTAVGLAYWIGAHHFQFSPEQTKQTLFYRAAAEIPEPEW